ncbi:MAG: MBL fold metallo-hydrolase [Chloroflexi bacterium]|nr:MBL fold metallo-hydrolase [Chloroflexota bacterium]
MLEGIHWLGHASFRLNLSGVVVYVDPWRLHSSKIKADVVLITHDHHDHLSMTDLKKISTPETVIVYAAREEKQLPGSKAIRVTPGEKLTIGEIEVETVPAYNIGKAFHPREAGYVGYIVRHNGRSIYHAGDTDKIPEMADLGCDVALLPIGGKYTMDVPEAIAAVALIKPGVAVPMHYGQVTPSDRDEVRFAQGLPAGRKAEVLSVE